MKKHLLFPLILLFAACNNNTERAKEGKTKTDTLCFLRADGQDTAVVRFIISEQYVTGEIKYLPWQKDARVGSTKGIIEDNVITAEWACTQEGMTFTVPVRFKINSNSVLQQENKTNETGEEYLPEDQQFTIEYKKMDCSDFPERKY